ncbi:MAG: hypothetical protein ACLUVG_09815 [Phocaeicola vulgatus]
MLKENYSCLNEKEMQLCCMMIAGFKTEEIAAIWSAKHIFIDTRPIFERKLKLPDGANIITFLSQKNEINKKINITSLFYIHY